MNIFRSALIGAVLLAGATSAWADVIYLTSGGLVRGEITKETRRHVVVKGLGGTTVVPRQQIDRIVRGESLVETYRKRLKKIDRNDPEKRYALGLWLKSKKQLKLAKKEFKATIELDPNHRFAREELGYVRKNGEWIGRGAEPASARAKAGKAATPRVKRYSFKIPVSAPMAQALANIRSKKAEKRAKGWPLLKTSSQEVERIMKVLTAERAPSQARIRSAVIKHVPAAQALFEAQPVDAAALRPHVESYVSQVVDPAVGESLKAYVRSAKRHYARGVKRLKALLKDFDPAKPDGAAGEKRTEALKQWVAARDEALRVIFDKSIYPDANHGKSGQPIVDEKVEKVRAVWAKFDHLVQKDLAKFLTMSEAEAKERLARIASPLACLAEVEPALSARNVTVDLTPPAMPALYEVLLRQRANDLQGAEARASELSSWGQQLVTRLQDERVRAYNQAMGQKNPHAYGKKPQGDEVQQVKITNDYRIMMGRAALEIDPRLVASARGHSRDMTTRGFFAHESPVPGKRSPFQRMALEGYPAAGGENIAMGYTSPKAAHTGWYNSSGHHRNILGASWRAMGSGRDGKHWTQNFGSFGVVPR